MKYDLGQKVSISLSALMTGNSDTDKPDLAFVDLIVCDDGHLELYNDTGELCCLDGEECIIDHIVVNNTPRGPLYDLLNINGETTVHFMLSRTDLDIAVFKEKTMENTYVLCIRSFVEDDTEYWSEGSWYEVIRHYSDGDYILRHNYGMGMIYAEDFDEYFRR